MQASRASAAPREQAARVPKIGRQAAHSADTRALRTAHALPQANTGGQTKNESGAEPCGSAPDPYMIRGKMMSYLR